MNKLSDIVQKSIDYLNFISNFDSGLNKHAYLVVSSDKMLRDAFLKRIVSYILQNKEMVEANSHPDYIYVGGNEKGNILVEDVLKAIDKIQFKASLGKFKVVVINVSNVLSERVQNKLLKTLEEPPTDTLIFVAVNNLTGILPTIISRTEKLVLNNLSENLLSELGYTSDVIKKSNNILYLCEKLTNDKSKFEMVENCLESLQKSSEVIEYSRKFCKSKDDAKEFLFYFGYIFKLLIKQNLGEIKIYSQSLVENFSLMVLAECITALEKANSEIDSNCVLGQVMDKFLFKILEVKYICKNNI